MAHFRTIESKKKGVSSLGDMIGDDLGKYLNMKPTSDEYAHKGDRQVNKIYAILKWRFKWDKKHMYNYILSVHPGVAKKLEDGERKHYNMTAVFLALTKKEKGELIKRIEAMEKRYKDMNKLKVEEFSKPFGNMGAVKEVRAECGTCGGKIGDWEDMING
jgi:hypothetical protein